MSEQQTTSQESGKRGDSHRSNTSPSGFTKRGDQRAEEAVKGNESELRASQIEAIKDLLGKVKIGKKLKTIIIVGLAIVIPLSIYLKVKEKPQNRVDLREYYQNQLDSIVAGKNNRIKQLRLDSAAQRRRIAKDSLELIRKKRRETRIYNEKQINEYTKQIYSLDDMELINEYMSDSTRAIGAKVL